ncbi:HNH endonuclease [Ochrobactrum sp. C6C9]|uniref:HNH endonuclease n=1 Tax=Ochrobactrum sp. C6C9 TaxID=2736662 RepID=UPI0035301642|nr:HNH endonuclease [Ochrobactrum sp. C6C9]
MSEVLRSLEASEDPIDKEMARVLRIYQNVGERLGSGRLLGYEPKDIRELGAIEVIQKRVRNAASGFNKIPAEDSYEAVVDRFPDRFDADVVTIARERLSADANVFSPTDDPVQLDARVTDLVQREYLPVPKGQIKPRRKTVATTVFERDPAVKAYILKQAKGRCEACNSEAPFKMYSGLGYLEVHHLKPLAMGGSDRVQNAVALCPNCHRAMHYAEDMDLRAERLFEKFGRLIPE